MKNFVILLSVFLLATLGITGVRAQTPENGDKQCVVVSASMNCDKCVSKIERAIPFEKGIKDVQVDFDRQQVTVTYDVKKTDPDKIVKAFEKIKVPASIEPEAQNI